MMAFGELLRQHRDAIVTRWLEAALSAYPSEGSAAFRREKDPFANPVGHYLRTGTGEIFDLLLAGADEAKARQALQEIIKIRAVQELSPSRAVGFVLDLKDAVRAELGEEATAPQVAAEVAAFGRRVDDVALLAFEVYVECRERLSELRINEAKRQVSWVVGKMNAGGSRREGAAATEEGDVQREGVP
jgi:hypothetical protein